ncbi:MAG: Oxidoreductase FAD/NAD(P)-binding domain protein [Candidatus Woesebacteria bacterium GW2011_GWB1_38_5]|uniref:Oxidoreductase FAD/NAD(P)-binding domain protein n=2 Tax=Candidatus Woeseibacteriota TaxID=1752722 RepID=A0A0G0LAC1_9BACT|nr:MAG: Oxidoreductase FAD/NAD(P)-binding domain protein [Candidatus Woesebacteria bacterium GW2011_GWB1_38_5]KKQ84805.1 MAG: Oxidoreductase FAD/NAD(P)-binding domain protein [Candidatus Woesebacteria bacterium GW2011_GWA1_38_8]
MDKVKIISNEEIANNVRSFKVEKPKGYRFVPGQAVKIFIEKKEFRDDGHPFTLTSLNSDNFLEFFIKQYPESDGFTKTLHLFNPGDSILIDELFGSIIYKGTGLFLAAGSGITPFISIFRDLINRGGVSDNGLLFSNKTFEDIILYNEIKKMFSHNDRLVFTLSQEERTGFAYGRINRWMLRRYMQSGDKLYICGPKSFVKNLSLIAYEFGKSENDVIFER